MRSSRERSSVAGRGWFAPLRLLLAAYTLLIGAWIVTNPPGFAPDEPAHYSKAVGMGHGEIRGLPAAYTYLPTLDQQQLRWQNANSRSVFIPQGFGECLYFRLPIYGRCPEGAVPPTPSREITYVGAYPPYTYAGEAALMRLGHSTYSALLLGRVASGALSLALLAAAAWALCRRRLHPLLLLGLVLTVTPSVLFICAELATSGPEITAGICLAATLLRLADDPPEPEHLWLIALASGVVLAVSRQFGPVWIAIDCAWFALLVGRTRAISVVRRGRRHALATALLVAAAGCANLLWQARYGPQPQLGIASVGPGLRLGLTHLWNICGQAIAVFGWADVPMPHLATGAWTLLGVVLLVTAWRHATVRERATLVALAFVLLLTTLGVSVALAAASPRFPMQARYVLPVGVTLPLLVAEIAYRHRARISIRFAGGLLAAAAALAALVHAWSLQVNADFYRSNQFGYLDFIRPRTWQPGGGWIPAIMATAVATGLLATVALRARRIHDFAAEPAAGD